MCSESRGQCAVCRKGAPKYREVADIGPFLDSSFVTCSEADTSSARAVLQVLGGREVHGIFTAFDEAIEAAAVVAEDLNLRFLSSKTVRTCRDKMRLAELCRELGFNAIPVSVAVFAEQAHVQLNEVVYPVVVKPRDGTGSIYAKLCMNKDEAIQQCHLIWGNGRGVLVQEFVPGPLVSVETFTYEGKTSMVGVTDRIMGDIPYFVEVAWSFPVSWALRLIQTLKKT